MKELENVNAPIALLGGPVAMALPGVLMRYSAANLEFPVVLIRDRTIFVPEWLDESLILGATQHAKQFEKDHRIMIHELLKRAQLDISPSVTRRTIGTVNESPRLNGGRELVFQIAIDECDVVLHISWLLVPCQFHPSDIAQCNAELLFAAYDVALEHMQSHVEELEAIGFDTSVLKLSVEDWHGYRERLRLV